MSKKRVEEQSAAMTSTIAEGATRAARRWPSLVEHFVNDSVLAKTRGVNEEEVYALGQMLESWEKYRRFCENNGNLSDLGTLPKHALEIITADFGTSIVPHIASVQPIQERLGIVYFKTVRATKTRGNIEAGDYLQHPFRPPHASAGDNGNFSDLRYPEGYAGEYMTTVATVTGDGISTNFAAVLELSVSDGNTIRPRSVIITGTYVDVDDTTREVKIIDDGEGALLGNGVSGFVRYAGSLGQLAGITNLSFTAIPAADDIVFTVQYATDFEESGYVPEINFTVEQTDIEAEIFALTQSQGMFKAFEFQNRFGQSAEEMIARDLIGALNLELGNTAITRLVAAAENIPNNTVTFNAGTPQYVSYMEHMQQLKAIIVRSSSTILRNAGRGQTNYLIAGYDAAGIIATLPGWTQQIVNTPGSNIWGTLDGMTVIRAPHIQSNAIYCVYKGNGGFDTPLVYSPYMPLVVSKTLQDIDNILKNRAVAAVWAGMKVVAPTFVTKIVVDNSTYVTPIIQP